MPTNRHPVSPDWLRSLCPPPHEGNWRTGWMDRPWCITDSAGQPWTAVTDGKAALFLTGHLLANTAAEPEKETKEVARRLFHVWTPHGEPELCIWDEIRRWAGDYVPPPPCRKCKGKKVRRCQHCKGTGTETDHEGKPMACRVCDRLKVEECWLCYGDGLGEHATRLGRLFGTLIDRNMVARFIAGLPDGETIDLVNVYAGNEENDTGEWPMVIESGNPFFRLVAMPLEEAHQEPELLAQAAANAFPPVPVEISHA